MGVPALFRWLSTKYPKITSQVVEDIPQTTEEGEEIPIDWSEPNPNGLEFDNLYLDMNGIIHPCAHPEDKPAPETESIIFLAIFEYIDRLVRMVRPRRLLYMAIDGVAPRAKMNQQRSRRFRAAQDAKEKEEEEERVRKEWEAANDQLPPRPYKGAFDSNVITPGTPFMENLAVCLRYYVADRMQHDPSWAKIKVILSDASVPGEGEHKIMDYIRRQRSHASHDPNTSHVLYGLDADLIMLALATHEPHFRILREDVFAQESNDRDKCFICGQKGHQAATCTGKAKEKTGEFDEKENSAGQKPFVFLHVPILREYLEAELSPPPGMIPFPWSLERAIDDWVFLCFFVGNDFLPHLPSLEIREGAIDSLVGIWKRTLPLMGGYLTDSGELDLGRLDLVMEELGKLEDEIFRLRREKEEKRRRNEEARKRRERAQRRGNERDQRFGQEGDDDWRAGGRGGSSSRKRKADEAPEILRSSVYGEDQLRYAMPLGKRLRAGMLQGGSDDAAKESADINREIVAKKVEDRTKANMEAAAFLRERLMGKTPKGAPNVSLVDQKGTNAVLVSDEVPSQTTPEGQAANGDVPMESTEQMSESEKSKITGDVAMEDPAADGTDGDLTPVLSTSGTPDVSVTLSDDGGIPGLGGASTPDVIVIDESDTEVEETMVVADVPIAHKKSVDKTEVVQQVEEETGEPIDEVRLWEPGWKGRYYRSKFGVDVADTAFRRSVVGKYIEGLCWVLKYYYQGVQSWPWFYPFHYSPFASDCTELSSLSIKFELGKPFAPLEQLMGVLPSASDKALPVPWRALMREEDSVIGDFYPSRFKIDLNGKKYAWQGVALLPFIDESRLFAALREVYTQLTPGEARRNSLGYDRIYVHSTHELFDEITILYRDFEGPSVSSPLPTPDELQKAAKLLKSVPEHIMGSVAGDPEALVPGATLVSPLKPEGQPDISNILCVDAVFFGPHVPKGHVFQANLLPGVKMPQKVLTSQDVYWARVGGANRGGRGGRGRGGGPPGPRLTDGAMRMAKAGVGPSGYGNQNNGQGNEDRNGDNNNGRWQGDSYWQRGDDYRGNGSSSDRGNGYDNTGRGQSQSSGYQDRNSSYNSYDSGSRDSRGYRDSYDSNDRGDRSRRDSDRNSRYDGDRSRGGRSDDRGDPGHSYNSHVSSNPGGGWRPSGSYGTPQNGAAGGGWRPSGSQQGYAGDTSQNRNGQGYQSQQSHSGQPGYDSQQGYQQSGYGQNQSRQSGGMRGGGNLAWSRNARGGSR